jgi:hypothetical protein
MKLLCICCHLMNILRQAHAVSPQPSCLERHAPPGLKEPCPLPAMRLIAKKEEFSATPNSPFTAHTP